MEIEIIAVGNEVVTGHVVNTNAGYIARRLQEFSMLTNYHTAVRDIKEAIQQALACALKRSQIIFFIGGLGPTDDDLTKEAVCEYLNKPTFLDEEIYKGIVAYFSRTKRQTPENNKKQAYFPKDAIILKNANGTAPGCLIEHGEQIIILLPGPPKELIPMFEDEVVPYLKKKKEGGFYSLDIRCFGIGESHLAEQVSDLLGEYNDSLVASYVDGLDIILRVCAYKMTYEEAYQAVEAIKIKIVERLKPYIIGYNENKIEDIILEKLKESGWTVSVAESCTGGLLAGTLVNCSGISNYFKEGVITYSNEAKINYLNVRSETLKTYGAVSRETALEMAEGIKKVAHAHIGLATTGIAGPEGGTLDKPVGLVYIGIALPDQTYTYELRLEGKRQEIRHKAVKHTLYQLLQKLNK